VLFQEAATHPLCKKFQLKDFLLSEITRLPKYPLLIDKLLKYTQRKLLRDGIVANVSRSINQ